MQAEKNIQKYLFRRLCNKAGKTIREFDLIKPNDRILIGISGGKDSLLLTEILANRKKHLPFSFELFAIHIKATGIDYKVDEKFLHDFCNELNIPLIIKDIQVDIEGIKNKPCFICSWNRRKAIFDYTREMNCNKLAFGHHMDDAIETMLMNMMFHSSISSLPTRLKMFEGRVEVIRPLLEISEKEILEYVDERKFPENIKSCPHEDTSQRNHARQLLVQMENMNKNVRKNLFRCTNKIFDEYLTGSRYTD